MSEANARRRIAEWRRTCEEYREARHTYDQRLHALQLEQMHEWTARIDGVCTAAHRAGATRATGWAHHCGSGHGRALGRCS